MYFSNFDSNERRKFVKVFFYEIKFSRHVLRGNEMQVFIVEPHLTMTDVLHADEFNREVIKQLREYGVEFYEVTNKNITRRRSQLSGDAIVILYNEMELMSLIPDIFSQFVSFFFRILLIFSRSR